MIIASITLWSFLFNAVIIDNNTWAAQPVPELSSVSPEPGGGPGSSGSDIKEIYSDTFAIPESLGFIRDSWSPAKSALAIPGRPDLKLPRTIIVHIQDAHANYGGQHKVAEILEYVNKEYGVKSVNLEGGAKEYDLSPLTAITEAEIRQKVADYFVRNGRVNGPEYFASNNPGRITLWGIEDTRLYVENLAVYREALKNKREVDKYLGTVSYILTNIKIRIYPKELLELDAKYIQYKAGNLDFKEYLSYLLAKARQKGIDINTLGTLGILDRTLQKESEINFKRAGIERDEIIGKLRKKLSKKNLRELTAKTSDFKLGRLSQKDFYDYLASQAKTVDVDISPYAELRKYVDYVSLYASVDKPKVMSEISRLEASLKETMFTDNTQRKLDTLSKNLALLKNIFNISLSKDDYSYFISRRSAFDMSNYISFIKKETPGNKMDPALDKGILKLDQYREEIARFYEYSLKRDEAFLRNIRYQEIKDRDGGEKRVAMMVTGGFHTENLAEHFRQNNIAYVSIMPNFRNNRGYKAPYLDLLAGQETEIERAIDASLSSMQIYDYLSALGGIIDGEGAVYRFRLSVRILTVIERSADDTCVVAAKDKRITFKAERNDENNIINITYKVDKASASDDLWDINADTLEIRARPGIQPVTGAKQGPAIKEKEGAFRPAQDQPVVMSFNETVEEAEPIYKAIIAAVGSGVDILNSDVDSFHLAPVPFQDLPLTTPRNIQGERKLKKNNLGVYADNYRYGGDEDWYADLLNKFDGMIEEFGEAVKKKPSQSTARFVIRLIGLERRQALEEYIDDRLKALYPIEAERDAIKARILLISVDVADSVHLNPLPDLITDMLTMEYDRYDREDYSIDMKMPGELIPNIRVMLNATTVNPGLEDASDEYVRSFLNELFLGKQVLRIRPIDWKSIDEWKRLQDEVLRAL